MTEVQAIVAVTTQLAVLVAAVGAGLLWFKRWVRRQVADPLASVQAEVTPNQGNSMKDAVDSTALAVDRTEGKLDALVRRFEDHLVLGHGASPSGGE